MMLVPTYVAPSTIHGIGIFAAAPIAAGTRIWAFIEGLDTRLDAAALSDTPEPIRLFLRRYTWPHPAIPGKIILDGDHGRFMNHSFAPNTDFRRVAENIGCALVYIETGEEMTCDYSEIGVELNQES